MADVTIESIAIEITASADNADKALQKLTQSLAALKAITSGGLDGANKVAKGLKQIAEAANSLSGVDGEKLKSVAAALDSLKSIGQMPDLSKAARSIKSIATAINGINGADMATFSTNMQSFVSAVQPLSSLQGIGDVSKAINALGKLPKVAQGLQGMDLGTFARQMQQITAAIQPFVAQASSLSNAFANMPAPIQQAVASLINYNQQSSTASSNTNSLGKALKFANFTAFYFAARKVISTLNSFITSSNEYIENLNLFTVTMGAAADEALEFANKVNSVMGIDVSQWIQNQGVFKQMTSGFGMVEEKANLVSKNLTQLGYDISSYYNISVESAMQKLQSGLAGEVKPLRELGYSVEEATIKQVALNHGITESVSNMSQAQKAQLRYIAIMEQSKNAMGDLSRTIESPSNQLRILESRIETLKRAIGDSLLPVITTALPYVTAFVQILGEFFRSVAEFMGFELPVFDYSDLVTAGNTNIADSFDEATEAANKFKGSLSSIDQLNIIGSKNETSQVGDLANGYDLNLELPSYDFLGGLEAETSKAYNAMKSFFEEVIPWVESFAAAWGAIFVTSKIGGFITSLSNLKTAFGNLFGANATKASKMLGAIGGGLAAGASSGILFYNSIKNLITGSGNLENNIAKLAGGIGIAGGAIAAFIALGNPVGAVITGIGAAVGIVWGVISGVNEEIEKNNEIIVRNHLYNNGGTKISEIADAFDDWANAAIAVNRQTIDKYTQLKEYDTKIGEVLTTMQEITGINIDFSGITPADAEALKEPFNQLVEYLKGDFQDRCQAALTDLKEVFLNLGLGDALTSQFEEGFNELNTLFNENLTESQKVVTKYLDKISKGGNLSDVELEEFSREYGLVQKLTLADNPSWQNVQESLKTLKELDLTTIDWETDTTAQDALSNMLETKAIYEESVNSRYAEEIKNLDIMRQKLSLYFEAGKITPEQYKEQLGLLDISESLFAQNALNSLNQLNEAISPVLASMISQLGDTARDVVPKLGEEVLAGFASYKYTNMSIDDLAKEIAASNWLNKNPIYNTLQDELSKLRIEPDIVVPVPEPGTAGYEFYKGLANNGILPMTAEIQLKIDEENEKWQIISGGKVDWHDTSLTSLGKTSAGEAIQGPVPIVLEQKLTLTAAAKDTVNTDIWNQLTDYYSDHPVTYDPTIKLKADHEVYNQAQKINDWILKGLTDGMSQEKYASYMSELADYGAQAFCTKYGIHSPSTLFKSYGDYIMQGLANGIDHGKNTVLSSLGDTANAMEKQMKGLEFSVPVYTENDMKKLYNPYGSYYVPSTQQPEYKGADPEAVGSAARVWNESGKPIDVNVNVQSYVELDGDQVGEATTRYQQRQMAYSNGY